MPLPPPAARSLLRIVALALAAFVATAGAQDFPKLKSGLWAMTTTQVGREKQEPGAASLCLDESVQQEMYRMSMGAMAGMCSKHGVNVAGNKVTTEAVCELGTTKMQVRSVMTLTGDTAYRTETHASFDPPLKGTRESVTVVEGKHAGDCRPGQKPGDMTLPNGQIINVRQMMGGKKG